MSRDVRISLSVFFSGTACFTLLYYFQPILPSLADHFSISAARSSWAVSGSTLGMVFGLIAAMFFADLIQRRILIFGALGAAALMSVISSWAPNFMILTAYAFIKGFVLSGATSVTLAYISEEVSSARKTLITGLYIAGNALGGMFGRVMSSYLCEHYGWSHTSWMIGAFGVVFALLFWFMSPQARHFTPQKKQFKTLLLSNWSLISSPSVIPYYILGFVWMGLFVSLYNYMGFFLIKAPFAFPPAFIHSIYCMYVFGMFASIYTAKLIRRYGIPRLFSWGSLGIVCSLPFFFWPNFVVVCTALAIFTMSFFVVHVLCNRRVSDYHPQHRSVTISIYLLFYYLGSTLLGSGTGLALDYGSWQWFMLTLILLAVAAAIYVYLKNRKESIPKGFKNNA